MPQVARDVSCVILCRILIIPLTFSSSSPSSASCSSSSSSSKPWKSPFDSYEIPAAFNLASNFLILCSFWYTLAKSALVVASLLRGAEVLKDEEIEEWRESELWFRTGEALHEYYSLCFISFITPSAFVSNSSSYTTLALWNIAITAYLSCLASERREGEKRKVGERCQRGIGVKEDRQRRRETHSTQARFNLRFLG